MIAATWDHPERARRSREQGLTILLVSQEVERSLEFSQRAYVLENGQIILEGKSDEMLDNDRVRESSLGM